MRHATTSAQNQLRAQCQAPLDVSEARRMLTTVEDSLETIVDVLEDMRALAADSVAQKAEVVSDQEKGRRGTFWGWLNENSLQSRFGPQKRLRKLADEIDYIVHDSNYAGIPLFRDPSSSSSFFVEMPRGDTFELSFEPMSAAILAVTSDDIQVRDDVTAGRSLERIGHAIADIQLRLQRIGEVRERLADDAARRATSPGIGHVDGIESAHRQLEQTSIRIADTSNEAMLAHANATVNSTMHLFDTMYAHDEEESLARIYSLDHDRESAPVTHLRRIMLGQSA